MAYQGRVENGQIRLEDGQDLPEGAAVYVVVVEEQEEQKPTGTLGDFLDSPLFGMWEDREDITDSAEFAEKLRRDIENRRD